MPSPSWLPMMLCAQIVLVFFAPPIPVGSKTLFLSDLWILGSLFIAARALWKQSSSQERRQLVRTAATASIIAVTVYAHGAVRTSVMEPLSKYLTQPPDDHFSPIKEAVVAVRFLSWFLAAFVLARLKPPIKEITRTLAACVGISVIILAAAKVCPSVNDAMGKIYLYDPHIANWADRIFGVFRSPVEGSITLGFALVLLAGGSWTSPAGRGLCGTTALLGILLTKTITSLAGLLITVCLVALLRLKRPWNWTVPLGVVAVLGGLTSLLWNSSFVLLKRANFVYRFQPWRIFWSEATSRWDLFLLGNGFNPHFVDNTYVFLFNRGGILLLASFMGYVIHQIRPHWREMNWHSRSIVIFLFVSGLTVDNLIIRPVAAIFIAVAIPILSR